RFTDRGGTPLAGLRAEAPLDAGLFVRRWLVLAPLPADGGRGDVGLDREQFPGEAALRPRAGDKITAGGRELAWGQHHCRDCLLDFSALVEAPAMDGVGYAVTFVAAPEGVAAKMRTGGEGRCKVWLNGELAYRSDDEVWAFRAEEEVTDVTLRKGV